MTKNINVINNTGNKVDVVLDAVKDGIQIVINPQIPEIELSLLSPGDVFEKNGVKYIVCEQFDDGTTAVVRKECLDMKMEFGYNNNWIESKWRKYLNNEYLKELEQAFGINNIVEHRVDLTSLDGYDDYGISTDKVSVMNIDRYRKYHKHIGNTGKSHYLSTPNSTPSGFGASGVLYVNGGGSVDCGVCGWCEGARPFFILKSYIIVSKKEDFIEE